MLIHAEKDSQIPVDEAYLLHNANKKSEIWIIENADHGMTHSINTEKYERRVIEFFKEIPILFLKTPTLTDSQKIK